MAAAPDLGDASTAESRFRLLAENASDVISRHDLDGRYLWVSPSCMAVLGYLPDELAGRKSSEFVHPDDVALTSAGLGQCVAGKAVQAEYRVRRRDGRWLWVESTTRPLLDAGGETIEIHVSTRDIQARKDAEAALEHSETQMRLAWDNAPIGMALVAPDGSWMNVNQALCKMLGYDEATLLAGAFQDITHPDDLAEDLGLVQRLLDGSRDSYTMQKRYLRADGAVLWATLSVVLVRMDGVPLYFISQIEDVTDRKTAIDMLEFRALHDSLTGLPNRALVLDRLSQLLAHTRPAPQVALLFCDLDRFKVINDSLGHIVGDEVLRVTAARLRAAITPDDTVGRLGGDEFLILLTRVPDATHVAGIAARIRDVVSEPIDVAGRPVTVTVSIGVVIARADSDPQLLLRDADTAMYTAKDRGRNRWDIYDSAFGVAAQRRLNIELDLRSALESSTQIVAHYQPIVELSTSRLVGYEALVRWNHPQLGLLQPSSFIDIAEQSGLIVGLGQRVLELACERLSKEADPQLTMSINVSAGQFGGELARTVRAALLRHDLPAERIVLELTESALLPSDNSARSELQNLDELGVNLAIDDFGTGYSALSYLLHLPVDRIKLDRAFTSAVAEGADGAAFITAIVHLAHALNLTVTAEGVESAPLAAALAAAGCDYGQGHHLGLPVP